MNDTIQRHPATEASQPRSNDFKPAAESNPSEKLNSAELPRYSSHDDKFDTELGKDDALLASLGYKAELKREFTAARSLWFDIQYHWAFAEYRFHFSVLHACGRTSWNGIVNHHSLDLW